MSTSKETEATRFGERLKKARELAELSKAALARLLHLDDGYLTHLEKGQRTPSDRTIRDLTRVLGVNEAWLRNGPGLGVVVDASFPDGVILQKMRTMAAEQWSPAMKAAAARFRNDKGIPQVNERVMVYKMGQTEVDHVVDRVRIELDRALRAAPDRREEIIDHLLRQVRLLADLAGGEKGQPPERLRRPGHPGAAQ